MGLRQWPERLMVVGLTLAGTVPLLVIGGILVVFVYQSWLFFQAVPLWRFLTETGWTPQFANQEFGILVLLSATVMVSAIAMAVAIPLGLLSAIYLKEYASLNQRRLIKPVLETLSGVPTVVYGYFALLFVTPQIQAVLPATAIFNSLSAGLVTGLLITPIVASLSEDALRAVPEAQRRGAYGCGLTASEVVVYLLVPAAMPGILASFTLAASRALGETMIAAIAAGQRPTLTLNPLVPTSTITAFIIQVSLGDVPTESLMFKTIFAVGMTLFLLTLTLNGCGHWLVYRYQRLMAGQAIPTADVSSLQGEVTLPPLTKLTGQFQPAWYWRQWGDRVLRGMGLAASLAGPVFFGLLVLVTFRNGISYLNWQFLTSFTSRDPAAAGIFAALMGTLWLVGLTALIAVPMGLAGAIYLEEYGTGGLWSRLVEVNITNATAIPGILYGLLGLAVFARFLGGITGGRTVLSAALMMSLLVLPLLITTARSALRSVPLSLKKSGYAVGMSRWQVTWHITLPAALPDLVTGVGLALSRVLGETSPLIALGTVEFLTFVPTPTWDGIRVPFTTLTTQIFFWLSRPQPAFQDRAAAAVLLLGLLGLGLNVLMGWARDRLRARLSP